MEDEKIRIVNLCKSFKKGLNDKKQEVLKDISLSIKKGETLGIIGVNGCGKTTLLKILAGIYNKNSGKIKKIGNIHYLASFGQGLKQKLTMKENIYLIGFLMGLTKKEISKRFNEIVKFAELEGYVNTPVEKFSSGMISRLKFSTTVHCLSHKNPDILLIDEAFGGGSDISFQKKSFQKIKELIDEGETVIMVTHNLKRALQLCGRVIWIDNGEIKRDGKPQKVIEEYVYSNLDKKNARKFLKNNMFN